MKKSALLFPAFLPLLAICLAQNTPAPLGLPKPGSSTDAPYAPQPILPGGVVVTLYPPGSPFLNKDRVREAEQYNMSQSVPGRINSIVNIHNPSIEVHTVDHGLNTGAAVILVPGGGHNTLNVGSEGADFVPFFYNYGVNTIILRSRLRRDGYNPRTDEVYDAQQSIRLVRAHAKEWNIDPHKIGIMGFSAGAELATAAAVLYDDFDKKNSDPGDPLAGISSRPDFVGVIYPGPTPFARNRVAPPIPRNVPPSFIASAGSDDQVHAIWADEYIADTDDWLAAWAIVLGRRPVAFRLRTRLRSRRPVGPQGHGQMIGRGRPRGCLCEKSGGGCRQCGDDQETLAHYKRTFRTRISQP